MNHSSLPRLAGDRSMDFAIEMELLTGIATGRKKGVSSASFSHTSRTSPLPSGRELPGQSMH